MRTGGIRLDMSRSKGARTDLDRQELCLSIAHDTRKGGAECLLLRFFTKNVCCVDERETLVRVGELCGSGLGQYQAEGNEGGRLTLADAVNDEDQIGDLGSRRLGSLPILFRWSLNTLPAHVCDDQPILVGRKRVEAIANHAFDVRGATLVLGPELLNTASEVDGGDGM